MSQNGKGMTPRKGYNFKKYIENYDDIFRKPIKCDICGEFVSYADLDSGLASRTLTTPDSDYSIEEYETFCPKCKKVS